MITTHGQGLLDLDKATQPIGELGISTTGRTSNTASISGSIAIDNGVNGTDVSSVSAVDALNRDFIVDLSSMVSANNDSLYELKHTPGQSWGIKYANVGTADYLDFTVGTDNDGAYAIGYTHALHNDINLGIAYSKSKSSPWVSMSGVWGEVTNSTTTDANITWSKNNAWAQAGIMNTKTNIKKGLVTDISDAISAYAVGGIDIGNLTLIAGIKPKVIKGSINLFVPTSVDVNGIMHYNNLRNDYTTETIPFIRANHMYYLNKTDTDVSIVSDALANSKGDYQVNALVKYKF